MSEESNGSRASDPDHCRAGSQCGPAVVAGAVLQTLSLLLQIRVYRTRRLYLFVACTKQNTKIERTRTPSTPVLVHSTPRTIEFGDMKVQTNVK